MDEDAALFILGIFIGMVIGFVIMVAISNTGCFWKIDTSNWDSRPTLVTIAKARIRNDFYSNYIKAQSPIVEAKFNKEVEK